MFTHLHVHTQYSMLDGAIRIGDLIEKSLDASFLLSMASMFSSSEESDTSEHVQEIVSDYIADKHAQ